MATAIDSFIPELWDAGIQVPLENRLVFGDRAIANRKYQGQISKKGDTVNINSVDDVELIDYEVGVDLPPAKNASTRAKQLKIDQAKLWQLIVEDLEKVQAAGEFEDEVTRRAGYLLADAMDKHIASLWEEGTGAETSGGKPAPKGAQAANRITSEDIGSQDPYEALTHLWAVLYEAGVEEGAYAVLNSQQYAKLLRNPNFINAEKAADGGDALRNGRVGRAANFDIRLSTNVPQGKIYAGINKAVTVAQQLVETEALRMEKRVGNLVRGLNVWGATVVYNDGIAVADLTVPVTEPDPAP